MPWLFFPGIHPTCYTHSFVRAQKNTHLSVPKKHSFVRAQKNPQFSCFRWTTHITVSFIIVNYDHSKKTARLSTRVACCSEFRLRATRSTTDIFTHSGHPHTALHAGRHPWKRVETRGNACKAHRRLFTRRSGHTVPFALDAAAVRPSAPGTRFLRSVFAW